MKKAVSSTFRSRLRVGGLVVALAVLGALIVGPSALSANPRLFTATFTSTVPGGENGQAMSLTIQNLGTQALGSANVTAPAGVLIQSVSGLNATSSFSATSIQLRDLNLATGASLNFPMTAHISCPARNANWGITGFKNGDGSGQTFPLDPSSNVVTQVTQACTLSITVQPNHAEAGQTITNTAYDPSGPKVTVVARNNDPAVPLAPSNDLVTLGKTAGSFTSAGTGFTGNTVALSNAAEAVFTALQSGRTGFSFKLTATATGYTSSGPSSSFDVEVDGCTGANCNPSTPPVGGNKHTSVSASGAGMAGGDSLGVGLINYSASEFTFPPGFCSDGAFVPLTGSDGFTTSVQQSDVGSSGAIDYTVTAVLDKTIMNAVPVNGNPAILTCFFGNRIDFVTGLPRTCSQDIVSGLVGFPTVNDPNGDGSFRAKCDAAGTGFWGGLLANVPSGTNACTDTPLTDPGVLSMNRSGGPPGSLTVKMCKPSPPIVDATHLPWDGGGGWR
jgi:hypothetical protein